MSGSVNRLPLIAISGGVILLISLYFWEIGHLNGIRQGSEALYLQVSSEMYNNSSFLTPLYRGEHHWSKPPLHFWLPFPIYWLTNKVSLGGARVAVAILGLLGVFGLACCLRKFRNIPWSLSFITLGSALGILKYARTYMMEIPLALLPAVAMLLFWYSQEKPKSDSVPRSSMLGASFGGAVVLLALSVLVKGPVTLAMAFISLAIYQLYLFLFYRRWIALPSIALLGAATLIASSWFLYCHYTYPNEFFEYFFLRENLGKFNQVSMPAIKLLQGVLLYSLPWLFVVPATIILAAKRVRHGDNLVVYLLSLAAGFFFIWFIPSQKSHHYAIPALPYFLSLAIIAFHENQGQHRWIKYLQLLFSALFTPLLILALYLANWPVQGVTLSLVLLVQLGSIGFYLANHIRQGIILQGVSFVAFWCMVLPFYFLPLVPPEVVDTIKEQRATIHLVDRRSYFFEQALKRPVTAIDLVTAAKHLAGKSEQRNQVIIYQSKLGDLKLDNYQIVHRWKKWIRKVKLKHIKEALRNRDLTSLKEPVYLLESRSK